MPDHPEATQEAPHLIVEQARRVLGDLAAPPRLKRLLETPGSFDAELWRQASELGWPAAAIAEAAGGLGLGWQGLALLSETVGYVTASLPLIGAAVMAEALQESADGAHAELVSGLASGRLTSTLAFAEAGETSLSAPPRLRWRNGRMEGGKAIASFAAIADYALVHASAGAEIAVLLVDLRQQQVHRELMQTIDNSRAAAALRFDGAAAIRVDNGSGNGLELALHLAATAVVLTAFEQVGGSQACLDLATDYAKQRKVFGGPIGRFQAIKHKLADVYTKLEIARGCALDALAALDRPDPGLLAYAAAARLAGIDAYDFAARECIQTFGGIGVTWEADPHHHYRRARVLALELGSAPFWREILVERVDQLLEGH